MQFGFNAPTAGQLSEPGSLIPLVVGAEAMGWDYATFSDHVVIPNAIHATYPYSDTGEFPGGASGPPWGSCSFRPTCRSRRRCGGRS